MAIPLYQLPTKDDPEYKYVKPSPDGYDGYAYQPPWETIPFLAKIGIVLGAIFPFALFGGLTIYAWFKG